MAQGKQRMCFEMNPLVQRIIILPTTVLFVLGQSINACLLIEGKQLIHRRLSKTKSIGSGSDPVSQAGRQSDGYGGWWMELRRRK